jgi:hypothetical protein
MFDFVEIVKPIQRMIKKDTYFKWMYIEKEYFEKFKVSITTSSALQIPYFSKKFVLYTFASNTSLVVVLTHKDLEGN